MSRVILTSDGKVNGLNGESLQEDYKKINRINNGVAIAYAGDKFLCELIIRNLKERLVNNETADVDIIYNIIMQICIENLGDSPTDKVQLIISGIRADGRLGMKTISTNNNYASLDYIPDNNQICTANATSDGIGDNLLDIKLRELFNNKPIQDIPEIFKVMNDTSRYMATIDSTVNQKIFREIIKL